VILATMGGISYRFMQKARELSELADMKASAMVLVRSAETLFNDKKTDIRNLLLTGKDEEVRRYSDHGRKLDETLDKLEKTLTTEEGRRLFSELHQTAASYDLAIVHDLLHHLSRRRRR